MYLEDIMKNLYEQRNRWLYAIGVWTKEKIQRLKDYDTTYRDDVKYYITDKFS